MKLELFRTDLSDQRTIGHFSINGVFFGYTMEDAVRVEKIPGKTAIPYGRYRVVLSMSNRFKKVLPLLLDVPNFQGVRIHSGNTEHDTEGCILIGFSRGELVIQDSKRAMDALMARLMYVNDLGEEIWIDILPKPKPPITETETT